MYKLLGDLKNAKASRIDNIPERILEKSKESLTEIFDIFIQCNISLDDLETCPGVSHL